LLPGKGDAIKPSGAIAPPHSFRDLALPFLRHGLMAFGGPAAHVAMHHFPALQTSGDLRLGVWGQTGTFEKFNSESQNDVDGIYAIFDQALWNPLTDSGNRSFSSAKMSCGGNRASAPGAESVADLDSYQDQHDGNDRDGIAKRPPHAVKAANQCSQPRPT
jgi:hypothetical protein